MSKLEMSHLVDTKQFSVFAVVVKLDTCQLLHGDAATTGECRRKGCDLLYIIFCT